MLLTLSLPPATAQVTDRGGKLSRELESKVRGSAPDDFVAVIVQTRDQPTSGHFARLHGRGGNVKARHSSIRGYSARVPASKVAALAEDPDVERISADSPVRGHLDVAYAAVRADQAARNFGGLNGAGVGIALVDTGVQAHPDLMRPAGAPPVVEVEVVGHETGLADYYGHGTHVAGIIGGNGASSSDPLSNRSFRGLAPGAQIISIRAMAEDGSGFTSDIITAIDWAVQNRSLYNIRVLNLSLGHPVYESYRIDPLCRAVRAAHDAGLVVVVAAGNDGGTGSGFGTITSPANEPSAITVGAMDDSNTATTSDDVLAWYSSRGPTLIDFVVKPDLVAPGTWIVSTRAPGSYLDTNYHHLTLRVGDYRTDLLNADADGAYYTLAGTSMAAPMVSAAAALMIQKEPSINPATVKARLMKSAAKDTLLVFETGAGYLDVDAALRETGHATSALSPAALAAHDGGAYLQDTGQIWGIAWPKGAIYSGDKGTARGIVLGDVPDDILSIYGAIWCGKAGTTAMVDNGEVTSSGAIWGGEAARHLSGSGATDALGAIWGGEGRK
ncbi:MAG: S8 family serine peptidase [Acidobacteria bacterium]|nr:S8 family serine peptidase [Acidobacteriota bacterium]